MAAGNEDGEDVQSWIAVNVYMSLMDSFAQTVQVMAELARSSNVVTETLTNLGLASDQLLTFAQDMEFSQKSHVMLRLNECRDTINEANQTYLHAFEEYRDAEMAMEILELANELKNRLHTINYSDLFNPVLEITSGIMTHVAASGTNMIDVINKLTVGVDRLMKSAVNLGFTLNNPIMHQLNGAIRAIVEANMIYIKATTEYDLARNLIVVANYGLSMLLEGEEAAAADAQRLFEGNEEARVVAHHHLASGAVHLLDENAHMVYHAFRIARNYSSKREGIASTFYDTDMVLPAHLTRHPFGFIVALGEAALDQGGVDAAAAVDQVDAQGEDADAEGEALAPVQDQGGVDAAAVDQMDAQGEDADDAEGDAHDEADA